jgi:predicted nucleic acid-binding protein
MLLVDTNVVAYLLIEGDRTEAAQQLRARDPDWRSEAFLLVEFTNVLASSIATKRMTLSLAEDFLAKAAALFDGKLGRIPHASVLAIAARHRSAPMMRASSLWQINSGAALSQKTPGCAPPRLL